MRILLIAESDNDLWKHRFYRERILDAFPDAIVIIACGENDPSKHREDSAVVYICVGAGFGGPGKPSADQVREMLQRQSLDHGILPSLYKADRHYGLGSRTGGELSLEQAYVVDRASDLIDEFDPHAMFMTGGSNIFRTVFCELGNRRGIPTYRMIYAKFLNPWSDGTRIWFCTNNYRRLAADRTDVFDHDQTACWQHTDALIESLAAPANRLDVKARAKRTGRAAFGALMLAKCVARAFVDCVGSLARHGRLPGHNPGWMLLRSRWNYERNKRLSIKPEDMHESFVIFPFNIPLDAQITLRAPQYQDQISTCAMIANVLPHDCHLMIREHPGWPGMLDHGRLKRLLRRHDNIRYISGDLPIQALFNNAVALITVNSTSALDATIKGLPVITLGETFYRGTGLTLDVDYPFDLQGILSRVFAGAGREDKTAILRKLLFDLLLETFPDPKAAKLCEDYAPDGMDLAADGIIAKLELIARRHEGSDRGVAVAIIDGAH